MAGSRKASGAGRKVNLGLIGVRIIKDYQWFRCGRNSGQCLLLAKRRLNLNHRILMDFWVGM